MQEIMRLGWTVVCAAVVLLLAAAPTRGGSWTPTATPTPTALPGGPAGLVCTGDCGGNRLVTVDELVTGVGIALGLRPVGNCRNLDGNGDGVVIVNELVAAVSRLLFGCDGTPPTPTPTNTPSGEQSVCGGPISSVPTICNLTINPARVRRGANITISFGIVDREGDIDTVCAGIGPADRGTPAMECMTIQPQGTLINIAGDLGPFPVGLPIGRYLFALQFRDRAGNVSQILTAPFEVFMLRV